MRPGSLNTDVSRVAAEGISQDSMTRTALITIASPPDSIGNKTGPALSHGSDHGMSVRMGIVITVTKGGERLAACLRSLHQEMHGFPDSEIIVVAKAGQVPP